MLPIRDDAPRTTVPYVTYFLIALNVVVFVFELSLGQYGTDAFVHRFGFVPLSATTFVRGDGMSALPTFLPLLTSMFLHASWLHILVNMWFLWIFGDNVEDRLGHFRYLLFYLLSGFAASLTQYVFNPTSPVPTVGASGAIAGVMGAYFVLFPSARVLTIIPFFFLYFTWLPAWVILGYWFVVQFLSGAATSITSHRATGGVAFWAHVGGFIAGVSLIKIFPRGTARYRFTSWQ